jgi:2-oxoglutarate/2-oxoacid ferredoxin oxidoreductase subunit alpha
MESLKPRVDEPAPAAEKPWATTGCEGRERNVINSLYTDNDDLEALNHRIQKRYEAVAPKVVRWEETMTEDAEVILAAYGTSARVCRTALDRLRAKGVRAGLFRPLTGNPYPYERLRELSAGKKLVATVEMNMGQMLQDVRLSVGDGAPVRFFGRTGGNIPSVAEVVDFVEREFGAKGGASE